jgi:hypothetical protein
MSEPEYPDSRSTRKSTESSYDHGTTRSIPPEDDREETREIVSCPARVSRTLDADALRAAEWIEVSAFRRRTQEPLDYKWTRRLEEVKKFFRRHCQAFCELRISGGPATARRILAALGEPDAYDSDHSRAGLYFRYHLANITKRAAIVAPAEGTYAWRRVTVSFPRDPGGRATIRNAVVILTVRRVAPKSAEPASPLGCASQSAPPF